MISSGIAESRYRHLIKEKGDFIVFTTGKHCSACKAISPSVDSMAKDNALEVIYVDVGEEPLFAIEIIQAMALPTIVFYQFGREIDRVIGSAKTALANAFAKYGEEV